MLDSSGNLKYFEKVSPVGIWEKFWANWGNTTDGDSYSACYDTEATSFTITFKKGDIINEYNQHENIFIVDYILETTPAVPNDYCKEKILKPFTQKGHIELKVGMYDL